MLKYFAFSEEEQADYNLEDYINIVEIDNESEIEFEDYVVKPYLLRHGKMRDIAYAFKKDSKVVGFSGDCTYDSNLERFAGSCNLCFLECCAEETSLNHLGYDKFVQIKNKYKQRFQLLLCRALSVTLIQASFPNPRLSSSCSDVLNGTATVATVSPPSLGAIVGLPPRIISCLCRMFSNVVCGSLSSAGTNAAVIVRDLGRVAGQPFFICKGRCGK